MDILNELLQELAKIGCEPSIYKRGNLWRAHINMAGNYWEDAETPILALQNAIVLWKSAGQPIDGMATDNNINII